MGISQEVGIEVYEWRQAPKATFAVIGDPVAHSASPRMHSAAFLALGMDHTYVAIHVKPGEVGEAMEHLKGLGYTGVNVTLPHKEEMLTWVKECDEFAARVHSVNTVRLEDGYGFNTDAPGFMETLRLLSIPPGTPTLLLGAGGSARALAAVLSDESYPLRIWNRTPGRAQALIDDLGIDAAAWDTPDIEGAGLVVNATSASLRGEKMPIDWSSAGPGLVAYDIAYNLKPNVFLDRAAEAGVRTVDGAAMLVMQGALSFEFWLETDAPHDAMWEAIR